MRTWMLCLMLLLPLGTMAAQNSPNNSTTPTYTDDGKLAFPATYREWIFLSSGVDMSYSPNAMPGHSMFDNVFVNPEAYKAFLETGTWPDKTMLVLEARGAATSGSINKAGHFQNSDVMGREVHVKDEARFPGKWAFFGFDDNPTAKMVPKEASCYSCHESHAAVDTTFVQFYPTLLDIAMQKGTLSAAYRKDEADSAAQAKKKK